MFLNLHRDPISFSTSNLLYINELPEYNTYLEFHSDSSVIMIEHIGNWKHVLKEYRKKNRLSKSTVLYHIVNSKYVLKQ